MTPIPHVYFIDGRWRYSSPYLNQIRGNFSSPQEAKEARDKDPENKKVIDVQS